MEPTIQQKNIAIAEMLGFKTNSKKSHWKYPFDDNSYFRTAITTDLHGGWLPCLLKFDSDANWQFEAIDWIENKCKVKAMDDIGLYEERLREVEFSFSVDICVNQCTIGRSPSPQYYAIDDDFLKLYDCRKTNKKESIFEALYQFSQYLKNEKSKEFQSEEVR